MCKIKLDQWKKRKKEWNKSRWFASWFTKAKPGIFFSLHPKCILSTLLNIDLSICLTRTSPRRLCWSFGTRTSFALAPQCALSPPRTSKSLAFTSWSAQTSTRTSSRAGRKRSTTPKRRQTCSFSLPWARSKCSANPLPSSMSRTRTQRRATTGRCSRRKAFNEINDYFH